MHKTPKCYYVNYPVSGAGLTLQQQQHERSLMSLWASERQSERFHGDSAAARHSPGQLSLDLSLAQAVVALHLQEALVQHTLADHVHALTHLQETRRARTHTHTTGQYLHHADLGRCHHGPEVHSQRTSSEHKQAQSKLNYILLLLSTWKSSWSRQHNATATDWRQPSLTQHGNDWRNVKQLLQPDSLSASSVLKIWLERHEADHFRKD